MALGQAQTPRDPAQQYEARKRGSVVLNRDRERSKDVFPLKLQNLSSNFVPSEVQLLCKTELGGDYKHDRDVQ